MTVKKTSDGVIAREECPIYRIRTMSERSDGRLMVSINNEPWNITKEQYKKLEAFMGEW
jgi:hypothetical protein